MAALQAHDIKILETTRQRLSNLASQLDKLRNQLLTSPDLPSWPSLQSHSSILSTTLNTVTEHLQSNSDFFDSTAIYPLPSYPGREQEGLLNQLLAKKLTPEVAEWADEGRKVGEAAVGGMRSDVQQWKELWEWAAIEGNDHAKAHDWFSDSDEDGEGENEADGDEARNAEMMEGVEEEKVKTAGPLGSEQWMKFMTRGEMPPIKTGSRPR